MCLLFNNFYCSSYFSVNKHTNGITTTKARLHDSIAHEDYHFCSEEFLSECCELRKSSQHSNVTLQLLQQGLLELTVTKRIWLMGTVMTGSGN